MPAKHRNASVWVLLLTILAFLFTLSGCQATKTSPEPRSESSAQLDTTVTFNLQSGAYRSNTVDLVMENPSGLAIVYTTDGSLPTEASLRAPDILRIDNSDTNSTFIEKLSKETVNGQTLVQDDSLPTATVIRAAALLPDGSIGPVCTNTYFVGEDLTDIFGNVMVISIVSDPSNLLDYDTGIMAKGAIYDEHLEENESLSFNKEYLLQANFMQKGRDWEREAWMEFFDGTNVLTYEAPCGLRIRGNISRVYAQKSFNVYFRDSYGVKNMDYNLFGGDAKTPDGEPLASYKSFCLRAGGNDTEMLHFRDSVLQKMMDGYDFTTQATRPAIVFLNGEFYGVFCLNEKYSDYYIESHFGIKAENVVIFEDAELDEGVDEDYGLYEQLLSFKERDLSDAATWEEFCNIVDVQSMTDYYAAQIFIGNCDFSEDKNYRAWRARDFVEGTDYGDTRWRFMLFDVEYSAGLYGDVETKPDYDTIAQYLDTCPLFSSAMRNTAFRTMVRERLVDLSENALEPARTSSEYDSWWESWEPWIFMGAQRFMTYPGNLKWDLDLAKSFFSERGSHIIACFDKHSEEY